MWVVIEFNNDDNHDAVTIGIYSTRKLAETKILDICELDYLDYKKNGYLKEFVEEDDRFSDDNVPGVELDWNYFKRVLTQELKHNYGCQGFSYLNYSMSKHTLIKEADQTLKHSI